MLKLIETTDIYVIFEVSIKYLESKRLTPRYMHPNEVVCRLFEEAAPYLSPDFINNAGVLQMELVVTQPNLACFVITDVVALKVQEERKAEREYQRQLMNKSVEFILKAESLDELIRISGIIKSQLGRIRKLGRRVPRVLSVAFKYEGLYCMYLSNLKLGYEDKVGLLALLGEFCFEVKAVTELQVVKYMEYGEILVKEKAYQKLGDLQD